ncbi:RHS repeat-associated core domain-containing protein [Flavobacterium sp. N1736]|uniref:RHS repeat-associated core domain-containing protein n=1 Tax=Flavobacterium sp. N1736 TaxID=2986823 RepID=UPI00222450A3|nr:RHS repeat-associated core domain-containing protein [Flavobacterium sp. N1736]
MVTTTLNSDGVYVPAVSTTTTYSDNQLYKSITKDENWVSGKNNTTEEFKNKEGKLILKRTYSNYASQTEVKHDTYYIYDIYGNLTYVLSPKAEGAISDSALKELCYQYRYDTRNRLVEKKLPGKEWEYIIYDKLDRPILSQDANLKASNKWMFTKYDAFGRPVYTGEYINSVQITRPSVQALANDSSALFENKQADALNINGTSVNYSNIVFPNTGIDLFTITYYDNYLDIDLDQGTAAISYGITPATNAKGLATCSKVRILGTSAWTTNVSYYDTKGRSIYNYNKNNYLNIVASVKTQLDFAGKTLQTTSTHKKDSDGMITIIDTYSYDHAGRALTQKQTINNQPEEIIANNAYDSLGQLIAKGVGGKATTQSRLQNVDYSYNIRGWLKGINNVNNISNNLFAFQINYNTPTTGAPLFNGNISQTFWRTANTDNSLRNYTYNYDNLNRLTQATDNSTINPGRYNEGIKYDKNGNIMSILRLGNTNSTATLFGTMDNLVYAYDTGNKLTKVEDVSGSTEGFNNGSNTAVEYTYDNNGNVSTDSNKEITAILYNYLNLPVEIKFRDDDYSKINYIYDALGTKQKKRVNKEGDVTETIYAGAFQYVQNFEEGNGSVLKFINQPEGYIEPIGSSYKYVYQYKDHLGNIRLSYADNNNDGVITSQTNSQTLWQDSFENPTGWDGTGASWGHALDAFDTAVKHSGNRSGRIDVHVEDVSRSVHSTQWIAVNNTVDTQYRISGWVLLENITQWSRARLELMGKKEGETEYTTLYDYKYITTKGEWIYVEKIVTVPANIKTINSRITLDYNTGTVKGSAWFDELKIEKITQNGQNEIVEENNYYPFGLKQKDNNNMIVSSNPAQKYKYNGKDLQDELGLGFYDFGARNYDPAIGRWMNIDPLAETSRRFSPYTYALNNPVFFIDPDGMQATYNWEEHNKGNKGVYNDGDKTVSFSDAMGSIGLNSNGSENKSDETSNDGSEPPVNFFARDHSNFAGTFDEKNKPENYQIGDGIFDVFGHGGVDGEGEGFFADYKTGGPFIDNAQDFDTRMSKVSPAYKKQIEGGFGAFTINLFICQGGSGNKSMAKKISKAHPNATVVAFDGFVMYGNDASGKSVINGASSNIKYNDNKGYRVVYQNGKEISRMLYSTYRASGKLF